MTDTHWAPKQWCLSKAESVTNFESWKQNLLYTLNLDKNFVHFLIEGTAWQKKTNANPLQGFVDDGETVVAGSRLTAAQKCNHLGSVS